MFIPCTARDLKLHVGQIAIAMSVSTHTHTCTADGSVKNHRDRVVVEMKDTRSALDTKRED